MVDLLALWEDEGRVVNTRRTLVLLEDHSIATPLPGSASIHPGGEWLRDLLRATQLPVPMARLGTPAARRERQTSAFFLRDSSKKNLDSNYMYSPSVTEDFHISLTVHTTRT